MNNKQMDLVSLFERALEGQSSHEFDQVGFVVQVGDFTCVIQGLNKVVYGELVLFEGGNRGIVLNIDEDVVTAFVLDALVPVSEFETVKRTGSVFKTPVGKDLLGRVINARGEPIDGLQKLSSSLLKPIEAHIPGIIERSPINEPLETGIMVIDALVPVGKGQRELIIGDRNTGKTSIALDTIIHQRDKNVICIYVAIGQRQASVARIAHLLAQRRGAFVHDHCKC